MGVIAPRGFKSHSCYEVGGSYQNHTRYHCQHTAIHYNIKTQNLPAERHRRFESCLGYNMPQYASGLSGLVKMLTASNPECSRYCRFVGTQFESGRDYGEHGIWRYRLTVRTWAFEACNSGSNPGNAL